MNKKLIIGVGALLLVAGGAWWLMRPKKTTSSSTSGGSGANGSTSGESNDATTRQANDSQDDSETTDGTNSGTNIKDLKGRDKRVFRKETRNICKEKYGSGKDFRDCKKRVKSGGMAFTGFGYFVGEETDF